MVTLVGGGPSAITTAATTVGAMLRMLLVRHGQSEWNAQGRWQGQADPPLSDAGRHQARIAAGQVGSFDGFFASPMLRASETAELIAADQGIGPVMLVDELMERDVGEWSGSTTTEIEELWPGYLAEGKRPPGFESDTSMLARIHAGFGRIAHHVPDGEAIVVAHSGIVYTIEAQMGRGHQRLPNLSAIWLSYDGGQIQLGRRVDLLEGTSLRG